MKHIRTIIILLLISFFTMCKYKNDKFIEAKTLIKKSATIDTFDYDLSDCYFLLGYPSSQEVLNNENYYEQREYVRIFLTKKYDKIEDLIINPDKNLSGYFKNTFGIDIEKITYPILIYKNRVIVNISYEEGGGTSFMIELYGNQIAKIELIHLVYEHPSFDNIPIIKDTTNRINDADWIPEILPKFAGKSNGSEDKDFGEFVYQNIVYPESAKRDSVKGSVFVSFWVETDCTTTGHRVVKSVRSDLDEEALRVAKLLPFRSPAFDKEKPVRYEVTVPIRFRLK